jgi:dolichyl-diphosphooligosaccharide--protein glycosyltransferase
MSWLKMLLVSLYIIGIFQLILWACKNAYEICLFAIKEYSRVIHEFDPYFNYRAIKYLWANGYKSASRGLTM